MIKRKNFNGKIRKREINKEEQQQQQQQEKEDNEREGNKEEEEEEEEIRLKLNEKKNNQLMRKRQRGLDAQIIQLEQLSNDNNISDTQKSIKSLIGNQFSTQNSSHHSSMLTHEKILEKYIEEKIGINNPIKTTSEIPKIIQEEEKLYYVPKEIKELEGNKSTSHVNDSGPGISCNIGLAEVALPIDYKLQNIEATEIAKRRMQEENELKKLTQRFTQSNNKHKSNNNNSNNNNNGRKFQMSTDDLILNRFKKQRK